jgi:CRP-like cAMP-binding protein
MTNHLKSSGRPVHNRILSGLPPGDFDRLQPYLEPVELITHHRLLDPPKPAQHVYFLESGMVSLVISLVGGETSEVGLIGNEGFVGIVIALGGSHAMTEAIVQISGHALRMPIDVFRQELGLNLSLRAATLNFIHALFIQVTQSVACNRHHSLRQRLARWLLMANDCGTSDDVTLSQEFLAMMLGVQRPTVSLALGELRDAGVIATGHGRINILDRKRLEHESCECYEAVKREYESLLGPVDEDPLEQG